MLIILASVALLGVLYAVWEYFQCFKCKDWSKVEGIVIQSNVVEIGSIWKHKMLLILFEYQIENKKYRSQRIQNRIVRPKQEDEVNALLEKYPIDKKVIVSYHPFFKRIGIVETDCKYPQHIVWFGFILFLVFIVSFYLIKHPNLFLS